MDNIKLPKTDRVIDLLEELSELEGKKAVLLSGPYTPDYVAAQAQDITFELAEIGAEIVQIVKDMEDELRKAAQPRTIWSGWSI